MKRIVRNAAALALAVLVSFLAVGCVGSKKGLPAIYIDGQAFPVTYEDGIKGVQSVHGGLLLRDYVPSYNAEFDVEMQVVVWKLFREDGTQEYDWHGEEKIWLPKSPVYSWSMDRERTWYALDFFSKGSPFSKTEFADEEEFSAYMEKAGYIRENLLDGYCRLYGDDGPIVTEGKAFDEALTEYARSTPYYHLADADDARVRQYIEDNRLAWQYAKTLLTARLDEGAAGFGCVVYVRWSEEYGVETTVELIGSRELIEGWIAKWNAADIPISWS